MNWIFNIIMDTLRSNINLISLDTINIYDVLHCVIISVPPLRHLFTFGYYPRRFFFKRF